MNKKKQNTNPFRIKKVGDKYEYDFMSYSDWEKIMEEYDFEGSLDDFEVWLKNLKTETYPLMKQKEIEWLKNTKELRDLIRKRQQRIEKEKRGELWYDNDDDKKENRIIKMKPLIPNKI